MKDLPKQVVAIMVYSMKNTVNQFCKGHSRRLTEILSSTPCMNRGMNDLTKCYSKYVDALLGAKHVVDKKKIPYNCW